MSHIEDAPSIAQVHLITAILREPKGEGAVLGCDE